MPFEPEIYLPRVLAKKAIDSHIESLNSFRYSLENEGGKRLTKAEIFYIVCFQEPRRPIQRSFYIVRAVRPGRVEVTCFKDPVPLASFDKEELV